MARIGRTRKRLSVLCRGALAVDMVGYRLLLVLAFVIRLGRPSTCMWRCLLVRPIRRRRTARVVVRWAVSGSGNLGSLILDLVSRSSLSRLVTLLRFVLASIRWRMVARSLTLWLRLPLTLPIRNIA